MAKCVNLLVLCQGAKHWQTKNRKIIIVAGETGFVQCSGLWQPPVATKFFRKLCSWYR